MSTKLLHQEICGQLGIPARLLRGAMANSDVSIYVHQLEEADRVRRESLRQRIVDPIVLAFLRKVFLEECPHPRNRRSRRRAVYHAMKAKITFPNTGY